MIGTAESRLSTFGRTAAHPHPGWAAAALGLAPIVLLGFASGGYDRATWGWVVLALGAVAGIQALTRGVVVSRLEAVMLASLAGLAASMLASSLWAVPGSEALREAERCCVYVAALGALFMVLRPSSTRWLLSGALAGVVSLALFALAQRALDPLPPDPYEGTLLTGPVRYANALGVLMAIGVVLGAGMLAEARGPARRLVATAPVAVSAIALLLTASRGAVLAALVGLAVLVALRWSPSRHAARTAALAVVGLLAAGVLVGASHRVSLGDRPAYWRVALQDVAEHPLLGSGAGTFDDFWLEHRPIVANVRDAHSLYLETAAELGVAGLALLLCALGTPLIAAARTFDRRAVATATAGYATFLVHAGLDWDWEMPVTTVAGLACGAAVLVGARCMAPDSAHLPRAA